MSQQEFKLEGRFLSGRGFYGNITKEGFDRLIENSNIKMIYLAGVSYVVMDESRPLINADNVENTFGYNGTGQTVCVVDTGIDYNHTNLGGCFGSGCKVLGGYDYYNGDADPYDDAGHGTHVAGTIASESATYAGIAPGADLVAVRVCNNNGTICPNVDIIDGLYWCYENRNTYNISVVSVSIGEGGEYPPSCPTWADDEIDYLYGAGIPVFVASGNNGHTDGISYPACSPNATSVGAVYDEDLGREPNSGTYQSNYDASYGDCYDADAQVDNITCFSNRDDILDLLAPGAQTTSTARGGGFETRVGTSMATPHVSGAAALLLEADSTLTPDQIKNILITTGTNVSRGGLTKPRIDVLAAINSLDKVKVLTINNTGDANLSVTSITDNRAWITSISLTSFTLSPGSSQKVTVTVDPDGYSPGTYSGTVSIYSNDPDENPKTVSVTMNVYCIDNDGDGYDDYDATWCASGDDCDDSNASINPNANEICNDGVDNDCDDYTDCSDGNCSQGIASPGGFCCGSGCDSNGGSCQDASISGFTCTDGNCNSYGEACQNGELESSLLCSGTSLVCSGGSCEYGFGAPQWCDEITPGDSVCENSSGIYDELACELSGTNCYYEAEYSCGSPLACDEKDQDNCSDNSGFQCEWQSAYLDDVVEECEYDCGAISLCDEQQSGYNYTNCTNAGESYFADKCSSTCQGEDRGDNICRSSAFTSGCTADPECNSIEAGTGNCSLNCALITPANITIISLENIHLDNTHAIFEFVIENNGGSTLTNTNWSIDFGDGNTVLSDYDFNLSGLESISVFIEHNYSSPGSYTVVVNTNSGTLFDSKSLTIDVGNLSISSFDNIYIDGTTAIFEGVVKNVKNFSINNINWSFDTGESIYYANELFNLSGNENISIIFEYNYTSYGMKNYNFTIFTLNRTYFRTGTIGVNELEIDDFSKISSNNTLAIFEFLVKNVWSTNKTLSWSFDTNDTAGIIWSDNTITLIQEENTSILLEHNFSSTGDYLVSAKANTSSANYSESLNVSI